MHEIHDTCGRTVEDITCNSKINTPQKPQTTEAAKILALRKELEAVQEDFIAVKKEEASLDASLPAQLYGLQEQAQKVVEEEKTLQAQVQERRAKLKGLKEKKHLTHPQ